MFTFFIFVWRDFIFVDIAHLTPKNIIDGRLIYQRQKTHGSINLMLSDKAQQIIDKYADYQKQAIYLFPILHGKKTYHTYAKKQ